MSVIICATGPINSGKSELCNQIRELEPGSIGFESGQLITELANECNGYLNVERQKITQSDDYLDAFNAALSKLEENHPQLFGEGIDINFHPNELLEHPEQFATLLEYLEAVRMKPDLLTQRITVENKDFYYRPLLKWIGGYMVYKVSPTVWFDEIGRRILRFQPKPEIITVNALRYPTDEQAMRNFAESNGYKCVVMEVLRPGTVEGTDVTEASRSKIRVDSSVINSGSIKDLAKTAKNILHDLDRGKLKPEYRTH